MPGDQFKKTLQARVEGMQVESHGFEVHLPLGCCPPATRPGVYRALNYPGQICSFPTNALGQLPADFVHTSTP